MMRFPRHLFKKRVLVNNIDQFITLINKYNGKLDCHVSLYSFDIIDNHVSYEKSIIDKVLFDFDSPSAFEDIKTFHLFLLNHNIMHRIQMTGRGYHCYVLTEGHNIQNKKTAIASLQHALADECGMKIGDPKTAQIDQHIIGDIARIARYPNTINLKNGLYCILLDKDFVHMTDKEIKELARMPQYPQHYIFGKEKVNLKKYDKESNNINMTRPDMPECKDIKEDFPPCIKYLLSKESCKYQDRYFIIIYLREIGLTEKECITLLQKYLSPKKFKHCVYEERQPWHLFRKCGDYFISRKQIQDHGACFSCDNCPIKNLYKEWSV